MAALQRIILTPGQLLALAYTAVRVHPPQSNRTINRFHRGFCRTNNQFHRSRTAYYDILQVSPHATQAQIKTAYYKQSFQFHPDKNAGSEEAVQRFAQISEAYSVLGSVSLRRKYDRGLLNHEDVQNGGRTSSTERVMRHRPQGSKQNRQTYSGASRASGSKPMFDFDAFYRAHYGEQLEREQNLRRWKEQQQHKEVEKLKKWKLEKMTEVAISTMLLLALVIVLSLKS